MTVLSLPAALRAGSEGLYALEAATGLIIAHGTWLERDDFSCFIHHGPGTAAIDREAAIAALDAGDLPSSAGEKPGRPGARQPRRRHHRHRRAQPQHPGQCRSFSTLAAGASSQSHVTRLVTVCTCLA
jgi:hypothetical protein